MDTTNEQDRPDNGVGFEHERFRLHTVSDLVARSAPEWLIERLFGAGSLIGVYGAPGEGKSFLALDWALSVATGLTWHGRNVSPGTVVYVAGEGGSSIRKRVQAWMQEHGISEVPKAFFILEGVQVREESDIELVLERLRVAGVTPSLIVLDTLARCFVGGDENQASDMGEFVSGVSQLQRETGAAVMVLHHSGKAKKARETERGSTAFRAACDVMIRVHKENDQISVSNNKQKDDEPFDLIRLKLLQVSITDPAESAATSCVLVASGARRDTERDKLPSHHLKALSVLAGCPNATASRRTWCQRLGAPERTLDSYRDALVTGGYVEPAGSRGLFRVTPEGHAALVSAATAKHLRLAVSNDSLNIAAATATTP